MDLKNKYSISKLSIKQIKTTVFETLTSISFTHKFNWLKF